MICDLSTAEAGLLGSCAATMATAATASGTVTKRTFRKRVAISTSLIEEFTSITTGAVSPAASSGLTLPLTCGGRPHPRGGSEPGSPRPLQPGLWPGPNHATAALGCDPFARPSAVGPPTRAPQL